MGHLWGTMGHLEVSDVSTNVADVVELCQNQHCIASVAY